MFFVLSGYLITSILLRNEGSPRLFAAFYARRALRIWPIYYLTLVALTLVSLMTPTEFILGYLPDNHLDLHTQWNPRVLDRETAEVRPVLQLDLDLGRSKSSSISLWPPLLILVGASEALIPICFALAVTSFVGKGVRHESLSLDLRDVMASRGGGIIGGRILMNGDLVCATSPVAEPVVPRRRPDRDGLRGWIAGGVSGS